MSFQSSFLLLSTVSWNIGLLSWFRMAFWNFPNLETRSLNRFFIPYLTGKPCHFNYNLQIFVRGWNRLRVGSFYVISQLSDHCCLMHFQFLNWCLQNRKYFHLYLPVRRLFQNFSSQSKNYLPLATWQLLICKFSTGSHFEPYHLP